MAGLLWNHKAFIILLLLLVGLLLAEWVRRFPETPRTKSLHARIYFLLKIEIVPSIGCTVLSLLVDVRSFSNGLVPFHWAILQC